MAQLQAYAAKSANVLLTSEEGREAGYWEKPTFGRPLVAASAYIILAYGYFVQGCALAGAAIDFSMQQVFRLRDAQTLASYFLAVPSNKDKLDAYFRQADEHLKTLPPRERANLRGNTRSRLLDPATTGTRDEKLLDLLWEITLEEEPLTIPQAADGFVNLFYLGLFVDPQEVQRLWGIQIPESNVPLMERSYAQAQAEMLSDVSEQIG